MGLSKELNYRIHFYEIDYRKRILPAAIINYFQDIAIMQSEELGVGIDFLAEHNLAWSLIQWDIKIHKYPVLGQEVKVFTRPVAFDKFYAYREFRVMGPQDELMADAYSLWVLKDVAKKRITKIPAFMFETYGITTGNIPEKEMVKPWEISRIDSEKEFLVRYSDIDTNRHVNNVKYFEWAIETMPLETVVKCILEKIRISYKKGTLFGDKVRVQTEIKAENKAVTGIHKITNEQDQTVCLLETAWVNEREL
ncbi:MAG: acyl-ACP thioesterase domain-containing protein [Dehalobacterium sp.]